MSSHKPGNRPKNKRSEHKHEGRTQHDRNQLAILQGADSMAHKERVRQDQLHLAILIGLKDQFVRSISLEERHWTNALPALWLAVWSCKLRHFDVAVANRRNAELLEHRSNFQKRILTTPPQNLRSGYGLRIVFRTRRSGGRRGVRIVAIEKRFPKACPWGIPQPGAVPGAVVGNKEAELLIEHQIGRANV